MLNGRPPFYKTPEELQSKIDDYFKAGFRKKKITTKAGQEIEVPFITITDLVIFLGFESRQSFYDYEKKEGFAYIIKRARVFLEREYEEMLRTNTVGAIFALKNFGWTDKQTLETINGQRPLQIEVANNEDAAAINKAIDGAQA